MTYRLSFALGRISAAFVAVSVLNSAACRKADPAVLQLSVDAAARVFVQEELVGTLSGPGSLTIVSSLTTLKVRAHSLEEPAIVERADVLRSGTGYRDVSLRLASRVLHHSLDLKWERLRMGTFSMGCHEGDCPFDELPIREVTIDRELQVLTRPVSVFQFKRAAAFGGPSAAAETTAADDSTPAFFVNWFVANEFCNFVGGRLPTEAEWEFAARGILAGKIGTQEEWVADWYDEEAYRDGRATNPEGPDEGNHKVVRGNPEAPSVTSSRDFSYPDNAFSDRTFRCVRALNQDDPIQQDDQRRLQGSLVRHDSRELVQVPRGVALNHSIGTNIGPTLTDSGGRFRFEVAPGIYTVTARWAGFLDTTINDVVVTGSQGASVTITMSVAASRGGVAYTGFKRGEIGALQGTIRDQSGVAMPNVAVTLVRVR